VPAAPTLAGRWLQAERTATPRYGESIEGFQPPPKTIACSSELRPIVEEALRYNPQREVSAVKTRIIHAALALVAILLVPLSLAANEQTVTLEVTGMS
jgi:hypothetical protein